MIANKGIKSVVASKSLLSRAVAHFSAPASENAVKPHLAY
jgi:hypothetical protein